MFPTGGGLDFTLTGIPVRIAPTFLLMALLTGLGLSPAVMLAWVLILFVSLMVHELGHAVAFRAFGVQPSIILHGMGGLTYGRSLTPGRDLVVSLSGPAAGLALGIPVWLLADRLAPPGSAEILSLSVTLVAVVNVAWGAVNLLPVLPLDGGNAMVAAASILLRRDTTRGVRYVSVVVAVAIAVGFLQWRFPVGAVLFGVLAALNVVNLRRLPRWEQPPVVTPPVVALDSQLAASPLKPRSAPGTRTFAQERDAGVRSVRSSQPELALLAADRARRLGADPAEVADADEIEVFAWLLLDRIADADAASARLPEGHPCRELATRLTGTGPDQIAVRAAVAERYAPTDHPEP